MSYQINLNTNLIINVENCNFRTITFLFLYALKDLFQEYVSKVLIHYFEENYKNNEYINQLKQFNNLKGLSLSD